MTGYCFARLLLFEWLNEVGCERDKPTLLTYEMIYFYLQGWTDKEEFLAHPQKLKSHEA